jgi:hypothetical protein
LYFLLVLSDYQMPLQQSASGAVAAADVETEEAVLGGGDEDELAAAAAPLQTRARVLSQQNKSLTVHWLAIYVTEGSLSSLKSSSEFASST